MSTDPGDGEAGERAGAEVPDDGGVGQQVQRLGGERPERGHREADDLPVVGAAGRARHRPAMVAHERRRDGRELVAG